MANMAGIVRPYNGNIQLATCSISSSVEQDLLTQLCLRLSCCISIITECQNCELAIYNSRHAWVVHCSYTANFTHRVPLFLFRHAYT